MTENTDRGLSLNTVWNIWYHNKTDDWSIKGYIRLPLEIVDMKSYWEFHNNLTCIGNITNQHFFMMRNGITPIYEDPSNKNGGRWSVLVSLDKANDAWIAISKLIVGENFTDDPLSINGITASVKSNVCVIQIWNNNKKKSSIKLPEHIFACYKVPNSKIIYTPHIK